MSNLPYQLDYLFRAEAANGNLIEQTPDDVSKIQPSKSAFYDVLQNLPLKTFTLIGKGHVFTVDFETFQIRINTTVNQAPVPPIGSKITPIYYRDVIQVTKNTYTKEQTLISKLMRWQFDSSPLVPKVRYRIGFQAHYPKLVNGKRNAKYEMTVV